MKQLIILVSGLLALTSCGGETDPYYRDSMRDFVSSISTYAKDKQPGFIVIPQNGVSLVTVDGEPGGDPQYDYLAAIDGHGQEDLFFGYTADNRRTPEGETEYLLQFLEKCELNGVEVLVTDYCDAESKMDESYALNKDEEFVSFAAPDRELSVIPEYPPLQGENPGEVTSLAGVHNFLYLINPGGYSSAEEFTTAIAATNYDLVIADLFFEEVQLGPEDIERMKSKANGGKRLVIAYMSIGEAEDYRYYWVTGWEPGNPSWLDDENPRWKGNYKVKYWEQEWQQIIFGKAGSYLDRIIEAGFDGVYLDIIEAFEYYE